MVSQVLRITQPDEAYFWATHTGAELDLLMMKHGKRVGVEFKRADAPGMTPSMRIALADLSSTRYTWFTRASDATGLPTA